MFLSLCEFFLRDTLSFVFIHFILHGTLMLLKDIFHSLFLIRLFTYPFRHEQDVTESHEVYHSRIFSTIIPLMNGEDFDKIFF